MTRKSSPLGGSFLNRLSFFRSTPINRDARRLVEPLDPSRKSKKKPKLKKKVRQSSLLRNKKQPPLAQPRKQIFRKDGTVVQVPSAPRIEA